MHDAKLFGNRRDSFLKCWISRPGATALGIVQEDKLQGYGVLRKCRHGCKIGPLFADSADLAETLFLALTADLPVDTPTFLDVPEVNPQAMRMAENYGMTKAFETARMYTKQEPLCAASSMVRSYNFRTWLGHFSGVPDTPYSILDQNCPSG